MFALRRGWHWRSRRISVSCGARMCRCRRHKELWRRGRVPVVCRLSLTEFSSSSCRKQVWWKVEPSPVVHLLRHACNAPRSIGCMCAGSRARVACHGPPGEQWPVAEMLCLPPRLCAFVSAYRGVGREADAERERLRVLVSSGPVHLFLR